MNEPLLLSVNEAAKALGISRNTAYGLIQRGGLKSIALGRRRLVPRAALRELAGFAADDTTRTPAPAPTGSTSLEGTYVVTIRRMPDASPFAR